MTRIRATISFAAPLAAVVALSGCEISSDSTGDFRDQFGVAQGAPDEFLIIAKQPLQMPPSFDLPRPQPGAPNLVDPNPNAIAYSALYQSTQTDGAVAISAGERVLLKGAKAEGDNSAVRAALADDLPEETNQNFLLDNLFGLPIPANLNEIKGDLASAEEVERLRRQGLPTPAAPPPPVEEEFPDAE